MIAKLVLPLLGALSLVSQAVNIRIDYSLDTNNFFGTAERRVAVEAVAAFYSEILEDRLLRIDPDNFVNSSWTAIFTHPGTGGTAQLTNPVIEEDEIVIFAGGRNLGGSTGLGGPAGFSANGSPAFFTRIRERGNEGAGDGEASTDFAPFTGSISFNTNTTFNFSTDAPGSGTEFISIALHEIGHVLGIGTSQSWERLVVNGEFRGAASANSFGGFPRTQAPNSLGNTGHFLSASTISSRRFESFEEIHGTVQSALMVPSLQGSSSNFTVATDLDLAALVDIGWEIRPRPLPVLSFTDDLVTLRYPTVSFLDYRLSRGDSPGGLSPISPFLEGTAGPRIFREGRRDRAFYLVETREAISQNASLRLATAPEKDVNFMEHPEVLIECGCHEG